ncbi:MAG: hypothetical protein C4331_04555 [Meiothermus sp.]
MPVAGLVVTVLLALAWLAGLVLDNTLRSLAEGLFNFLGAWAVWNIATHSPRPMQRVLSGLALGLVLLGVGDLLYTWGLAGHDTSALREAVYIAGVLLFLVMGTLLPISMERQGLYREGFTGRVLLLSVLGGVLLTALSRMIRPLSPVEMLYAGAAFYLTLIFLQQSQALAGGRIGRTLQGVVWALVLGSLARIVTVLVVATPPTLHWSVVVYDLLWISAMSVLVWSAGRRS